MSTGFLSPFLRGTESLVFLSEPPELNEEPGNLVNYEVLIMRQAQRQQTLSMAVRCYDAFSGVLSVSAFNRRLLVQN